MLSYISKKMKKKKIEKEKREMSGIEEILHSKARIKYRMIIQSFYIGILTSIVIVSYRVFGEKLLEMMATLYKNSIGNTLNLFLIFIGLIAMSLFVSYCVKKEPNISGSGIPQVEGSIGRKIQTNWLTVLVYKYLGGIVSMAAGLSIGREGPSVQMGAAIGEGYSNYRNKLDYEHKYLLTSGASAGLAAAFNAPLSGVMFALEEVHKNFSPIVLLSAMVSAMTADTLAKFVLGFKPALHFSRLHIMPIKYYWTLIILGIILGLLSYVFNKGVVKSKKLYKKMPIKMEFKIMIPFLLSALIGIYMPILLGGGHSLIMSPQLLKIGLISLIILLVMKMLLTFIAFGSGVPGGIFFPLLAIGALIGTIVGFICVSYFNIPNRYLINLTILAMAGYFAATVKAPITGIILIFEMTGSFGQLLPLSIVVFISLMVSEIIGVEPVYEMLLENILENDEVKKVNKSDKKTLLNISVCLGSDVEGKLVSEVDWPEDMLIVSIQRGNKEILPRGRTMIIEGDMISVVVNKDESALMRDFLLEICS